MKVSMIHRHNAVLGAACPGDNIPLNERRGVVGGDGWLTGRRKKSHSFLMGGARKGGGSKDGFWLQQEIFKSSSVLRNIIRLGLYRCIGECISRTTINHLPSRAINTWLDSWHHALYMIWYMVLGKRFSVSFFWWTMVWYLILTYNIKIQGEMVAWFIYKKIFLWYLEC